MLLINVYKKNKERKRFIPIKKAKKEFLNDKWKKIQKEIKEIREQIKYFYKDNLKNISKYPISNFFLFYENDNLFYIIEIKYFPIKEILEIINRYLREKTRSKKQFRIYKFMNKDKQLSNIYFKIKPKVGMVSLIFYYKKKKKLDKDNMETVLNILYPCEERIEKSILTFIKIFQLYKNYKYYIKNIKNFNDK